MYSWKAAPRCWALSWTRTRWMKRTCSSPQDCLAAGRQPLPSAARAMPQSPKLSRWSIVVWKWSKATSTFMDLQRRDEPPQESDPRGHVGSALVAGLTLDRKPAAIVDFFQHAEVAQPIDVAMTERHFLPRPAGI